MRDSNLSLRSFSLIDPTTNQPRDLDAIPLDDPLVFRWLGRNGADSPFRLEAGGIDGLLALIQPESIGDVAAGLGIFRFGRLGPGMADNFANAKKGVMASTYCLASLDYVLADTHGVLIFADQAVDLLVYVGDLAPSKASAVVDAASAGKSRHVDAARVAFRAVAVEAGMKSTVADGLFDLIERVGRCGIDRAQARKEAIAAYRTAWLQIHYPAAFRSAVLGMSSHVVCDDGK